jgi:hypothetical protein
MSADMPNEALSIRFTEGQDAPTPLLTIPGGIGLYHQRTVLSVGAIPDDPDAGPDAGPYLDIRFEGCSFRFGGNGDGLLGLLIPGTQETGTFDLGFRWDRNGFQVEGGAGLELTLPIGAKLPFVTVQALHLMARPESDGRLIFEISADLTGSLFGAVTTNIERIGLSTQVFFDAQRGQIALGPVSATPEFKAPTGVGLELDIGGVLKGGGFLSIDRERGRYAGVLSLDLFGMGVTAIGIINTRPFAFLAVVTANFRPVGLDISFGFTLNAVGGIFALQRTVDPRALSRAVQDNAVGQILFPAHPVEDAPRILNDLDRVFPPLPGHVLVGPMFELGWGKPTGMITLSLGFVLDLPDPSLSFLGILKIVVPPIGDGLLRLQVNFSGRIDLARQMLSLDGALYDSRLIIYALEGSMAARLRFGDHPDFLISVGGFNDGYTPSADLDVPALRRISYDMLPTSDNPRLRMQSYFAVTSNTFQHGARLELYAVAAGFGLKGFLGYDLLAQLSPLAFEASFGGAVAILAGGEEVMSLGLSLALSGPSAWHVDGEVSFKILFVRVRIPVHATFGDEARPQLPDFHVDDLLRKQIAEPRNWRAHVPDQSQLMVALKPRLEVAEQEVLAHPSSTIEFNQSSVPLGVPLAFFGAAPIAGPKQFELVDVLAGERLDPDPVKPQSEFAPGQYFERSADQKASEPAFERRDSGIRADSAGLVKHGSGQRLAFDYRSYPRDTLEKASAGATDRYARIGTARSWQEALLGSSGARSAQYRARVNARATGDEIKVSRGGFRVVDAATMTPADTVALDSPGDARRALDSLVESNRSLTGKLLVVAQHELG